MMRDCSESVHHEALDRSELRNRAATEEHTYEPGFELPLGVGDGWNVAG
jgi:hypothetical protein